MMSCSEVRPILSFLLEKETGPLETLEARRHLEDCDACHAKAERISRVMAACGKLAEQAPPIDLSHSVMQKLRAAKSASRRAQASPWAPPAAKWGGLAVLLGAALAAITRPFGGALRELGAPLTFIAGLLAGTDSADGAADVAGRAVSVALRFVGVALKPELTSGAGIDLVVTFQLLATALSIGFLLAIPVAILTAWFLHSSSTHRDLPRL
ncbi:MAG TPA: zf-HC2 domain-containing protein [Patescibacteria group bacterium]|jgi:anti-sigma factor RsiW|nr:zf-HC2 domain-containing protein [Patescibacteria group bacterium]